MSDQPYCATPTNLPASSSVGGKFSISRLLKNDGKAAKSVELLRPKFSRVTATSFGFCSKGISDTTSELFVAFTVVIFQLENLSNLTRSKSACAAVASLFVIASVSLRQSKTRGKTSQHFVTTVVVTRSPDRNKQASLTQNRTEIEKPC